MWINRQYIIRKCIIIWNCLIGKYLINTKYKIKLIIIKYIIIKLIIKYIIKLIIKLCIIIIKLSLG